MSWEEEFDRESADMGGSDYYKFKEGHNKMRILTAPLIKVSRFGFGVCYQGAPFCTQEALDKVFKETGKQARLDKKWEAWAIIRGDKTKGKEDMFKIIDLPYKVSMEVRKFKEEGSEYFFETFPMPFDINVIAKGAGTMDVEYSVQAARKNTEVTEEELKTLAEKMPIETILEKQKEKSRKKFENSPMNEDPATRPGRGGVEYPKEEINPDDIPF